MERLDDVAAAKADAKKIARTLIRLKHSLAADSELRKVVPEVTETIDKAVADGVAFHLNIPGLLGLTDGS